jgi:hypothetical protein
MDRLKLDRALTGSRKVASNVLKGWRTSGALKTIETKGKNRHKGKRYAPGDWNEKKQPAAT